MEFKFKRATLAELDTLVNTRLEVLREAAEEWNREIREQLEQETREYYRNAMINGDHVAYLVYLTGEFVGCGGISFYKVMPECTNPTGKKAYLMNIYTREAYRRKGIGTIILDMLVKEAKKRNITDITLETTDMSRHLYESYGFVSVKNEMILL